ncbi:hypothetical protein CKO28_01345 [Rhodovibrio sodomensis]|uniref:Uncharacterized protein n=1 Tax=Rhodovibrio sodomensis TaxID=1088 RepID=A0ABS1D8X1_9PROT|nr:hypothetical protein [Rhodovibrio sodomensis]MBK1666689.1 hypothetical protein [Rhodovibrio sodomensis]
MSETRTITRFTVEFVERDGGKTLIRTAGANYGEAINNAKGEAFDENHPELSHFEDPFEDGFEVEQSMLLDDCQSIRVFEGHYHDEAELEDLTPIHTEE